MSLNSKQILGADDLPRQELSIPEWHGTVWVRTMTGAERARFQQAVDKGDDRITALLAVMVVVDETGQQVFSNADVPKLQQKSGVALDRIATKSLALNSFGEDEVDALAKNSNAPQSGDSGSA